MALRSLLFPCPPLCSRAFSPPKLLPLQAPKDRRRNVKMQCVAEAQTCEPVIPRRSANYQPSIWPYDLIQSFESDYKGEQHARQAEELKQQVRKLLEVTTEPLARLELIDRFQRLGIGYHFERDLKNSLEAISVKDMDEMDLYAMALHFRLLRQHGFKVTSDVFHSFMDEKRDFKIDLCGHVNGVLSLYEASQLGFQEESIMDKAKEFSAGHLKAMMGNVDPELAEEVGYSLELPLHKRMLRLEARKYIDMYEKQQGMNQALLNFAKLDFNMVQAIHQRDVRNVSRWWRDHGLVEKLSFVRDRLMEHFFWTVGFIFDPQFTDCREGVTKVNCFITTMDDIYDVYGSLDELELFTNAVDRWDLKAMDHLPDYMKICFLALYNTTNELAYKFLKEQGWDIIRYLQKAWADICKSYLVEAKWYASGYTPTLEEYLENGWISIGGPAILVHSYFLVGHDITEEALQCLENYPNIIRWSSMVLRLCDDLGTSTDEIERGDVAKSIQCYMKQACVSEETAREHIRDLISITWKKLNEECATSSSPFPQPFINTCGNVARMAQCMYQYGDGHGVPDKETKDRVTRVLLEPIPM